MLRISTSTLRSVAIGAALFAGLGGIAVAAQDKYNVKVPGGGLGFSDFQGYEAWQTIGVSQSGALIEVILGNPAMIAAYQAGSPGNGKPFPDGAKMAKIHWKAAQSTDAPTPTTVHGALDDVDFMAKDSKRFSDSGGWGYAQFNYVAASDSFTPLGSGYKCGTACHNIAKAKDYVFTAYGRR